MLIGAIDIGGTKTLIGVVDQTGKILTKSQILTDTSSLPVWLSICSEKLKECLSEIGHNLEDLEGIGINLPGMVDTERGLLLRCSYSGWELLPVKEVMYKLTGLHNIFVENDVNSCAIGELHFGFQKKYHNFIWMTVSTGIGGAIVCEDQLIRGAWGCAGEIGHIKVEYDRPLPCSCGGRGCLEAHASGTAITGEVKRKISKDISFENAFTLLGEPMDAKGCAVLARGGDKTATSIYKTAAQYLGRGIGYAISLFNPDAVIIGGGVGTSMDIMHDEIQQTINETVIQTLLPIEIVPTRLGYMAALLGAAALVLEYNYTYTTKDKW